MRIPSKSENKVCETAIFIILLDFSFTFMNCVTFSLYDSSFVWGKNLLEEQNPPSKLINQTKNSLCQLNDTLQCNDALLYGNLTFSVEYKLDLQIVNSVKTSIEMSNASMQFFCYYNVLTFYF